MKFKSWLLVLFFVFCFSGNTLIFAMEPGRWETDVAVICDNGYRQKTHEFVKLMCSYKFSIPDMNEVFSTGFTDLPLDSNKLQAVLYCGEYSGAELIVNFKIFETKDLNQDAKKYIEKCAQTIIFYDLADPCTNDELNAKIREKVEFVLSFRWNNCVNFANYCKNLSEIKLNPVFNQRNNLISWYLGTLENTIAYRDYKNNNNRWDRSHCGVLEILLYSISGAYDFFGIREKFKVVDFMKSNPLPGEVKFAQPKEILKNKMKKNKLDDPKQEEFKYYPEKGAQNFKIQIHVRWFRRFVDFRFFNCDNNKNAKEAKKLARVFKILQ